MGNMLLTSKELLALGEDPMTSTYNIDKQMERVLMTREQREAERAKEEAQKKAAQKAEKEYDDRADYADEGGLTEMTRIGTSTNECNAILKINVFYYTDPTHEEDNFDHYQIIKYINQSDTMGNQNSDGSWTIVEQGGYPLSAALQGTDRINNITFKVQRVEFRVKVLSYARAKAMIENNEYPHNKFYYVENKVGDNCNAHTLEDGNQGIVHAGLLIDDARFAVIHESWHTMARYDDEETPNAKWKFGSHNSKKDSIMFGSQRVTLGKDRHLTGFDFSALNMPPPDDHLYFRSLPSDYKLGDTVEIEGNGIDNKIHDKSELW